MSISEFFIRRHVLTWMIMIGLIVFGLFSYQRVGISEFPDVDFPVVSISINREGSSPQLNEIEIADRVENAISSVQGIKRISSTSRTGSTEIVAEFDLGKDIDVAVQDIQSVLSRIQRQLPDDIDPPTVRKTNPEDSPILWLGITSKKLSRFELMGLVRDQVQPKFSTVDGVADIFVGGYVEPNLRVWVNSQKLRRLDLSVSDLVSSIKAEHTELPAGLIESKDQELNVRTYGEANSIENFLKLPILRRGGSPNYTPIQMSDVVTAELGLESNRSIARAMGETSVGLGIRKQRGVNAVQVANNVKERLEEVKKFYKDDLDIRINFDTTTFIKEAIDELTHTLLFAAILTSIVCLIFLGSFAATVNVVLAIPTALIGAFIFVYAFGYTLNTFTLLALSMAVGIVVDDAIMVHENISRHESLGKTPFRASIDGGREIFFAVIATTFSLLAIFTPVAYVQGVIGKYLAQFGLTLSIAVFLSMIEALTLTPMRYSQFKAREEALGKKKSHDPEKPPLFERIMHPLEGAYNRTLAVALNYKWSVIISSVIIFLLSLLIVRNVPKEFTPYQDVGRVAVMLRAPLGVSINYMDEKLKQIEAILSKNPSVDRYFGFVGGGQVNTGRLFVTLKPKDQREPQMEFAKNLRKELKAVEGIQVLIQDNASRGFSSGRGYPVEFAILGPNFEELSNLSKTFKQKMEDSGLMTDVDSNYREGLPEVQILPNRDAAALRGVSVQDINETIQAMIGGVVVGRYTQDAYRYDIRVRLREDDRSVKEDILKLYVRNNRGEMIPLSDLVTLNQTTILQEITREDRQRAITLTANVAPNASQEAALSFARQLEKELPDGYQIKFSGSAEAFKETFDGLILAMILGILVTYMLLASQFNSFLQPLIILLAIPFSLTGAFVALLVFGQSINIYSMIGILLVLGLVLKNSIMLVDFTNKKREDGLSIMEALKAACPIRLRPIIMTSLATIVGALPAALAIGPGAESRIPMALTIIGGMAISTFFTLYVVPCVYEVVVREKKQA